MEINQIGGYEIIDLVGEGGQGAVYRAQDPLTGQTVAIKILSLFSSDADVLDRFQREASIMATIRHPNVVEVYDHGEEDGKHYIVTEFVPDNLYETLKRRNTLPLARAVSVATQIASALEVSRTAGITHRDIKPANVLINDSGDVKLTDFGIATAESLDSMTSENTTVGTPLYMSPEQIEGSQNIDGRSDLYSLGCLLYETIVGSTPFQGNSTYEIFDGHIKGSHQPLTEHCEEVPELLDSILDLLLKKERDDRYQSASDLIKDLMELSEFLATGPSDLSRTKVMPKVLGTQKISTQNTPYSQGLPKWFIPLGGIIGLVVIFTVGGVLFLSGSGDGNLGAAVGISNELSGDSDSNRTSEHLTPSPPKGTSPGSQSKGISFENPRPAPEFQDSALNHSDGTKVLNITASEGGNTKSSSIKKLNPPSIPDLISDHDTGFSDSDDITSSRTLTFNGTVDHDFPVRLVRTIERTDGTAHLTIAQVEPNEVGIWEITTSQMPEGPQRIYALSVFEDGSVDRDQRSDILNLNMDRTPPVSSDFSYDILGGFGTIKTDGNSEPYSVIEMHGIGGRLGLSGGSTEVSLASTVANENGKWELEIIDLGPGDHQITKYEIDVAGNRSQGSEPKTFFVKYPEGSASVPSFKKLHDYLDSDLVSREYLSPHAAEIILAFKENPDTGVSLLSKLVHQNSNDATLALFAITQNCSYRWNEAVRKSFDFIPDEICSNKKLDDSKIPVELFSKLAVFHPSGANLILENGIHHDLFLTSMLFTNLAQHNALETVSLLDFYYSECGEGIEDWATAMDISQCAENVEDLLLQGFRTNGRGMSIFITHLGENSASGNDHIGSLTFQKSLSLSMHRLIAEDFDRALDTFAVSREAGIHVWLNIANFSDEDGIYPAWENLSISDTYASELGRLLTKSHKDTNTVVNTGLVNEKSPRDHLIEKIRVIFNQINEDSSLLIYMMADVDIAETSLLLHTLLLEYRERYPQYNSDRETDKIITAVIQAEDLNRQRKSLYGEKEIKILRTLLDYYPDLPSLLSENGKSLLNDAL